MARPSRTALHADDPTYLWKAILRAIAILFAIVGVGTIAWALINHVARGIITPSDSTGDDYGGYDDYYDGGYDSYYTNFATLPWTFITLGLSILWNIANLAVLFFRNKPIHPGANVGCDLVLWLGLCATGSTAVIGALNYFDYYPGSYDDGDNPYDSYGTFSNSSGTWYDLPNGSLVNKTVASGCGGFSTCAEERRYEIALQHKGVVIAVGAAMSFMVLYVHLPTTHARKCHKLTSLIKQTLPLRPLHLRLPLHPCPPLRCRFQTRQSHHIRSDRHSAKDDRGDDGSQRDLQTSKSTAAARIAASDEHSYTRTWRDWRCYVGRKRTATESTISDFGSATTGLTTRTIWRYSSRV